MYQYTESFSPNSTTVSFAYYNVVDKNLFMRFSKYGNIYGYKNVPKYVWEEFLVAESVGGYFNSNIKGKYDEIPEFINLEYINPPAEPAENHVWTLIGHSPIEYTFEGATLEEAKADFARLFPNGALKEVKVTLE